MSRHFGWLADPRVRRQLGRVERLLAAVADEQGRRAPFHRQLLSPRSKRLRPALLLLSARFGPNPDDELLERAAAGIELLHEATLYHDDIVDEAALRRGQPTVQRRYGAAVAALAGSELLYATAELFADLPAPLRRAIGRTGEALCHGQIREIETLGDVDLSSRERTRIMRDKTARLFALAARIGATVAGADDETIAALVRFGQRFGLCFQLADDLRDLIGTRRSLGRAPGADLDDGVYSLPVLFALQTGASGATALRSVLLRKRQQPQRVSMSDVRRELGGSAAVTRSLELLQSWMHAARLEVDGAALEGGPLPARRSLGALLQQLEARLVEPTGRRAMPFESTGGAEPATARTAN